MLILETLELLAVNDLKIPFKSFNAMDISKIIECSQRNEEYLVFVYEDENTGTRLKVSFDDAKRALNHLISNDLPVASLYGFRLDENFNLVTNKYR